MESTMTRHLSVLFILISCLLAFSGEIEAQDYSNVTAIAQYYHNWHDGTWDVAVQGDIVYMACGVEGVRIRRVSEGNPPEDIAHIPMTRAVTLDVLGNLLFVAGENHVYIYNITYPSAPMPMGNVVTGSDVLYNRIRAFNGFVFSCQRDYSNNQNGFAAISIADPNYPQVVWAGLNTYESYDAELREDTLYVGSGSFLIYDFHVPTSPLLLRSVPMYEAAVGVSLAGPNVCLAAGVGGAQIKELATGRTLSTLEFYDYVFGVRYVNGLLYIHYGAYECPLAIANIDQPETPVILGTYYPPQDLSDFAVSGQRAYVADAQHGLRTVDVSNPANPREIASYSRFGTDLEIVGVNGSMAYVREEYKLKVIDFSDPAHPIERDYFETPDQIYCASVVGNTAYVSSCGYTAFWAVDLTNPDHLTVAASYTTTDYEFQFGFAVYNGYAYLCNDAICRILDVSDPSVIRDTGRSSTVARPEWGHAAAGNYMAQIVSGGNVEICDLTNPLEPQLLTTLHENPNYRDMKFDGGLLYVLIANHLKIYELSNPDRHEPVAQFDIDVVSEDNLYAHRFDVVDGFVYVTCEAGLYVYDTHDHSQLRLAGFYRTPGSARSVRMNGRYAYVADSSNFGIYDCEQALAVRNPGAESLPQDVALLPNFPNPFNAITQIVFELPRTGNVTLAVYNMLGERVATLMNGVRSAGLHRITWDASSSGSGTYFYRLEAAGTVQTRKMVLIK
jgi:hypothetical protein